MQSVKKRAGPDSTRFLIAVSLPIFLTPMAPVFAQQMLPIEAANGFEINFASEQASTAVLTVDGSEWRCDMTRDGDDILQIFDCLAADAPEASVADAADDAADDAGAMEPVPAMTLDQAIQLLELMPPPAFDAAFAAFLREQNCVIDFSDEAYADNLMLYSMLVKLGIPALFGPDLRDRMVERAGDAVERLPAATIDDVSLTVSFEGVCD